MPDSRDTETRIRDQLSVRARAAVRARQPAGPAPAPTTAVGVLDRAVAVLGAVEQGARTFTAITAATGLTRPTAHRMITALETHGFLVHIGGLGYALGPRLLGLATTAMRELPLRDLAQPALERLALATGESAQLYVRDGDLRMCVDAVESDSELRTIVAVGATLPLTAGSAGKVFLAWGPTAGIEVDDRLRRQLHATRQRGWADSHGEREPGVASVSAPVIGPGDALLAAVSISGPASRLAPLRAKERAPAVLAAAREIERAMGLER
ncbi:MAG TPA: IclR family transcriptional regulator [Actinomycetota bacterium]